MNGCFRAVIRLVTVTLMAFIVARNAEAITVRVNCGATRTFASFTSPKELVFLVRNLGNCAAEFTAFDQDGLSGNVLASFTLEPNQAVSVNKPSPPNALARSISIAATGVEADGRALLDFAALPPDADPNWGRNGDAVYNLNLGSVGIGTSTPTERLDVNGTVQSFGYDGNLRLNSRGSGSLYQIVSRGADGAFTIDDVNAQASRLWIAPGTGNVGIGTTSPSNSLHVVGNGATLRLQGADHCFIELFPHGASSRGAYFGYPDGSTNDIWLQNEMPGRHIAILPSPFGGNVGVSVTDPQSKLHVAGRVLAAGYDLTSDERLKTDVQLIPDPLGTLDGLRGIKFRWNEAGAEATGDSSGERRVGLLAQEVQRVLPEVVSTGKNGVMAVDYAAVVPVLIEALKAQQKEIVALRRAVDDLKAKEDSGASGAAPIRPDVR